jgi:hypothetical protein
LTKSTKSGQKSTQSTNGKKGTQQLKSLEELGIPLDLNLFKQDIMYSQSDKFGTIAWTTLDECRRQFFDIKEAFHNGKKKDFLSYKEAIKIMHSFKLKSLSEFNKFSKEGKLPDNIPVGFTHYYYKTEGIKISVGEFLGTDEIAPQLKQFISYKEASKFVKSKKITTQSQWRKFVNDGKKPNNIPSNPDKNYIKTGEWINWGHFVGTNRIANQLMNK